MSGKKYNSFDLIVAGGGPAGIMAAGRAAELGAKVTLVEKTSHLGTKLLMTGGGRCNITNSAEIRDFIKAFGKNGKFLYRALTTFSNKDLIDFLQSRGLETRVDPDGKVFPADDKAASVLKILRGYLAEHKAYIRHNTAVTEIVRKGDNVIGVKIADDSILEAGKVVVACGGMSYPATGSSGDGYHLASQCGHTIVPLRPGLTSLESDEPFIKELPGLTLKQVLISVVVDGKVKASGEGDLLFTHFGVSGPLVLVLSDAVVDALDEGCRVEIALHLLPEYSVREFERYLQEELESRGAKTFSQYVKDILPDSLAPVFVRRCAVPPATKCSVIDREQRQRIAKNFTDFRIHITRPRPIEEATVTRGGVLLKEIDPLTMESKLVKGLYFCGEIIDLAGITGGFNLQEAFSTGYLAGEAAAKK